MTTSEARSSAVLSNCGTYRYALTRQLSDGPRLALWLMLNPSTADATNDDPTIRRCIAFSKGWGCSGLVVTNLFALRATDPRDLYDHADPVGEWNDDHLRRWLADDDVVVAVAAWGAHGPLRNRAEDAYLLARTAGRQLHCLGTTKSGQPRHPLYVAGNTPLQEWPRV